MQEFLGTILAQKRAEVKQLSGRRSSLGGRTDENRGFAASLRGNTGLAVVGEIKRASPSMRLIVEEFDPAAIAGKYETGGACAISVLTDEHFFQGCLGYVSVARGVAGLPVLRKDFIIDPLQVEETASVNADGMLLIAAALSDAQMEELVSCAVELGIDPLIEVHNGGELDRAMRLAPEIIGINNRDLRTFEVDLDTTIDLVRQIPPEVTVISESGIHTREDSALLKHNGVSAILVGESLMRSEDPAALIGELGLG